MQDLDMHKHMSCVTITVGAYSDVVEEQGADCYNRQVRYRALKLVSIDA